MYEDGVEGVQADVWARASRRGRRPGRHGLGGAPARGPRSMAAATVRESEDYGKRNILPEGGQRASNVNQHIYGHRNMKARLPVRSALVKHIIAVGDHAGIPGTVFFTFCDGFLLWEAHH